MQPNWNPLAIAVHRKRFGRRQAFRLFILLVAFSLVFIAPLVAKAQGPSSFWIAPYEPESVVSASTSSAEAATVPNQKLELVVDTDPGVDDATALAWLLGQPQVEIFGIVTVAGNTTVENATKNVLTILKQLGNPNVKVVMGANKPLQEKLSFTGLLIHGKDGLWGLQDPTVAATAAAVPKDHRSFYCSTARQHPGTAILALGPLTNIAQAIRSCPDAMQLYTKVYILGGAKFGGNHKPNSEFNFWQDPDAAQIVLKSGLKIDMVPLDGFTQLGFDQSDLGQIAFSPSSVPIMKFLGQALLIYGGVQIGAGAPKANIPDLVAAMYTVEGLGTPTSALVQVVDKPDIVRGESIIGLAATEKVTMIATDKELDQIAQDSFPPNSNFPDANFIAAKIGQILSRQPDNANVVMDINEAQMHDEFMTFAIPPVAASDVQSGSNSEHLYLPSVTGQ